MACFWLNQNETKIEIPLTEERSNATFYEIHLTVGDYTWTVLHRYSEFFDLHNQLVTDHGASKDLLPSKKVIRNKCPLFIESRRKGLEEYLQKILLYLRRTMPKSFVEFLKFNHYDIFFILKDLSAKFFLEADNIMASNKPISLTVLELHCLCEFLKKPFPIENPEVMFDLSPVLDVFYQLNSVKIVGISSNYIDSNIIPNKLLFELSPFKSLKVLNLQNVDVNTIYSLGNLRDTLVELYVNNLEITTISQVLQCDVIHKNNLEGSRTWTTLKVLDLSRNNIIEIDHTVTLAPKLKKLILDDNKISTISNISNLTQLNYLSLSCNLIRICNDLHKKLGNISTIILSQNKIVTCKGFTKLYSLETLDLSFNKITEVNEIRDLGLLPTLENLVLTGNTVAMTVDYRIEVLELFGERSMYVCLDNEKPTQAELDKVLVLGALKIVKEGKTPDLSR